MIGRVVAVVAVVFVIKVRAVIAVVVAGVSVVAVFVVHLPASNQTEHRFPPFCGVPRTNPLRIQVPNNHILTQTQHYNDYYPNLKYLIIGYMDPKP